MKILLIGADGQVGRELKLTLSLQKSLRGQQLELIFSNRNELDLRNLSAISDYLARVAPHIIINASAYTAVDEAETNEHLAFLINDTAVREMAMFCKRCSCRLVHISSDYIFDGLGDRPYLESDALAPSSVYGRSKLAGEQAIREILDEHIVKTMLRLVKDKEELDIVADQFGAPTSARAIAATIAEIVCQVTSNTSNDCRWGTYHFSGYPFVSWADFASEIFDQATLKGLISGTPAINPISSEAYPTSAKRPANSRLDCSKLKYAFGIEPDDWRRSLSSVLDELKEGIQN
jgi:dTDP-4-dehydrorhamnose reductase